MSRAFQLSAAFGGFLIALVNIALLTRFGVIPAHTLGLAGPGLALGAAYVCHVGAGKVAGHD